MANDDGFLFVRLAAVSLLLGGFLEGCHLRYGDITRLIIFLSLLAFRNKTLLEDLLWWHVCAARTSQDQWQYTGIEGHCTLLSRINLKDRTMLAVVFMTSTTNYAASRVRVAENDPSCGLKECGEP